MLRAKSIIVAALLLAAPATAAERIGAEGCPNPAVTAVEIEAVHRSRVSDTRIAHVTARATNLGALDFAAPLGAQLQLYARLGPSARLLALTTFDALTSGDTVSVQRVVALEGAVEPEFLAILVYDPGQFGLADNAVFRDCDAADNERRAAL